MSQGQAVSRVDATASAVWAVLADHRGMATWAPGISVDLERTGSPTVNGVGAIRVITWPGLRIREEITGFEPGRLLAYRALSGLPLPNWAGEVELAERDGHTTIRWTITSSSRLPAAGSIIGLVARTLLSGLTRAVAARA